MILCSYFLFYFMYLVINISIKSLARNCSLVLFNKINKLHALLMLHTSEFPVNIIYIGKSGLNYFFAYFLKLYDS